jgi:hypothetical protein
MADIDQDPEIAALGAPRVPGTLDYIGLAAALVPFGLSFRSSQSQSFTTTVTDASGNTTTTSSGSTKFSDPVALVGGGVAVIIALVLLTQIGKVDKSKRALRIGLAVGILALGAVQLVVRSGLLS